MDIYVEGAAGLKRGARIADLFRALGHPTRVAVIELLAAGELCVCEIGPAVNVEQPTLSRHLAVLRREGLVVGRKDGLRVIYRLTDDRARELVSLAAELLEERWRSEGGLWAGREGREGEEGES